MLAVVLALCALLAACQPSAEPDAPPESDPPPTLSGYGGSGAAAEWRVLVFSATAGYRHASIPAGIDALRSLGAEHGFGVDATEDATAFSERALAPYDVVVFLSTTGDVLDPAQQAALERFVRVGGGFVGVHAATDTEYDWPWYGELTGARFDGHPPVQEARIDVADPTHPSTASLPDPWWVRDEWYSFRDVRPDLRVLLELDEASYDLAGAPAMGSSHPIAWAREVEKGRSWYTGLGHRAETFELPAFRAHLLGGLRWAAGRAAVD